MPCSASPPSPLFDCPYRYYMQSNPESLAEIIESCMTERGGQKKKERQGYHKNNPRDVRRVERRRKSRSKGERRSSCWVSKQRALLLPGGRSRRRFWRGNLEGIS
ncbi:hypothetical protein CEXT_410671 [Caerostris extrusa]|uniref:Uncharacterized protein n=1 Tax=Caerostris extrusa TaxID=172846 RepID=A0AAV4RAB9_CAEEX|nr:hypothetical protein CEXT_410671 [Caerostris extrusa]